MRVGAHEEAELLLEVEVVVHGGDFEDFDVLGDGADGHCAGPGVEAAVGDLDRVLHPLVLVLEGLLGLEVGERAAVDEDVGRPHVVGGDHDHAVVPALGGVVGRCERAVAELERMCVQVVVRGNPGLALVDVNKLYFPLEADRDDAVADLLQQERGLEVQLVEAYAEEVAVDSGELHWVHGILAGELHVPGEVDRVNVGVHVDEIADQVIVLHRVEVILELALHDRVVGLELQDFLELGVAGHLARGELVLQQDELAVVGGHCDEDLRRLVEAVVVAPDIVDSQVRDRGRRVESVGLAGLGVLGLRVLPGFFDVIHLTPLF